MRLTEKESEGLRLPRVINGANHLECMRKLEGPLFVVVVKLYLILYYHFWGIRVLKEQQSNHNYLCFDMKKQ